MIRINGELVDPNLVEETFSRIKSEAEARLQVSCCERDEEFMSEAEEEVIDSILIAQEADRRQPEIPADQLKDRLEATIKLYRKHGASWDMLEAQRPQLRDECVANLRMESLLDAVLADVPELTDEDVRKYYQDHVDDYRCKPEVRCLHLVKLLEPDDQPVSPMDLLEKMISLREEVLGDADFAEVAKRERPRFAELAPSTLGALMGWGLVMAGFRYGMQTWIMAGMGGALLLHYVYDSISPELPLWYRRMRLWPTLGAVASLALAWFLLGRA